MNMRPIPWACMSSSSSPNGMSTASLAFRLVKPKGSPGYQSENALCREMLQAVVLPAWCKQVVVVADAASPSRANLRAIQARGWFFVIALPRTWKLATGQSLRDVVTHLPVHYYRQVRVPLVVPHPRRRIFWTFAKRAELRQVGDVTVVLSRRRRNDSPRHTNLRVPTRPQATARLTVALYLRRWPVEMSQPHCHHKWLGVVSYLASIFLLSTGPCVNSGERKHHSTWQFWGLLDPQAAGIVAPGSLVPVPRPLDLCRIRP
jgi:hypothetical protein